MGRRARGRARAGGRGRGRRDGEDGIPPAAVWQEREKQERQEQQERGREQVDPRIDPLEKMGRELKCPICWCLFTETMTLSSCSHNFCKSCITESMKRMSSCPVCKQPTTRREVRAAPHLDNLVAAYKGIERSCGFSLFSSQPYAADAESLVPAVPEGRKNSKELEGPREKESAVKAHKKLESNLAFADITNKDGQESHDAGKDQDGGNTSDDAGAKANEAEAIADEPFQAFVPAKKRLRVHVPHFARNEVTGSDNMLATGVISREPRSGPMRGKRSRGGKLFQLGQPSMAQFLLGSTSETAMCTTNERDPSGRDLSIALLLERSKEAEVEEARKKEHIHVSPSPARPENRLRGGFLAPRPISKSGQALSQEQAVTRVPLSPSLRMQVEIPPPHVEEVPQAKSPNTAGDAPLLVDMHTPSPVASLKDPRPVSSSLTPFRSKRWASGAEVGVGTWTLQGCSSSVVNKLPNGQIVMASNSIVQAHASGRGPLPPLFWLGDVIGTPDMTQPTPPLPSQLALARPSFDDLKVEEDESSRRKEGENEATKGEAAAEIDSFDSEVFAWTQHPCSPELDANLQKAQASLAEVPSPTRARGCRLTFLSHEEARPSEPTEPCNCTMDAPESVKTPEPADQGQEGEAILQKPENEEMQDDGQEQEQQQDGRQPGVQHGLQIEDRLAAYEGGPAQNQMQLQEDEQQGMDCGQELEEGQDQAKAPTVSAQNRMNTACKGIQLPPEAQAEASLLDDQVGREAGAEAEAEAGPRLKYQRQQKKVQWDTVHHKELTVEQQHEPVPGSSDAAVSKPSRKRLNRPSEQAGGGTVLDSLKPPKRARKSDDNAVQKDKALAVELNNEGKNVTAPKPVALKRSKIRRKVDGASAQHPVNAKDDLARPSDARQENEGGVIEHGEAALQDASLLEKSMGDVINDTNLLDEEFGSKGGAGFNVQCRESKGPVENECDERVCSFCRQPGDSQIAGELLEHVDADLAPRSSSKSSSRIFVHKKCADWAPAVYFENDQLRNLEAELARALKIKCSICGLRGAALGCYNGHCRKSFHFPCARAIAGCKWEDDIFVVRCPAHAAWKLGEERKSKPVRRKSKSSTFQSPAKRDPKDEGAVPGDVPSSVPSKRTVKGKGNAVEATEQHSTSLPFQKWPAGPSTKWVLTGSGLDSSEKDRLAAFIAVTGASLAKAWNPTVTHVVAGVDESGSARRTLKFLMATLEGKWILKPSWMAACTTAGAAIGEEAFEVTSDTHGMVDGPRRGRELSAIRAPKILHGFALYFCLGFETAYKADLQALILAAGGRVLHRKPAPSAQSLRDGSPRRLRTLVLYNTDVSAAGSLEERQRIMRDRQQGAKAVASKAGATALPHTWLLDSVAGCRLQPI